MKRILVASEEPALRRLVAACLRKNDFDILHHDDHRNLQQIAERESPDLLILDHGTKSRNGHGALQAFREGGTRDYKLLLISDNLTYDRDQAVELGADELIHRPFSPPNLRQSIRRLLTE